MLDTELKKTGTILMHEGQIHVEGFSADDCGCREVAAHALLWAIGEMHRELAEMIRVPGGTMKVGIGLPLDVEIALGIDGWGSGD